MPFPPHARHPNLVDTPSHGQSEVLSAMAYLHNAKPRAFKSVRDISRHLNLRQDISADVLTVLQGMDASLVESSGGKWRLTRAGLRTARHPRPRAVDPWNRR